MADKKLEKQLTAAIERLQQRKIPDDFIRDQKDFLRWRAYLPSMQYNAKVYHRLLELTLDLWHTGQRANRLQMLQCLVDYRKRDSAPKRMEYYSRVPDVFSQDLLPETNVMMVGFATELISAPALPLPVRQWELARMLGNRLLRRVALDEAQMQELILLSAHNERALNRVLRYPAAHETISRWALQQMNNVEYCYRRAELLGRVLDLDPDYTMDAAVLSADFEEMNRRDVRRISEMMDEHRSTALLREEWPDLFNEADFNVYPFVSKRKFEQNPIPGFEKRPGFKMESRDHRTLGVQVPDLEKAGEKFYGQLETYKAGVMLWAVYYSHLDPKTKRRLLKKHFVPEKTYTLMHLGDRMKDAEILKWLRTRLERKQG
ncbi:MAG: hypothetical protein JNL57_10725 [Bacteroidetes bacterium]|nr:hypothetical protein [Bacteroidota bacterium]